MAGTLGWQGYFLGSTARHPPDRSGTEREPGKKGAPKKHGAKFKLSNPSRSADCEETFLFGSQNVRIQAWKGLHLKKLSELVVMMLQVEFLKPDGKDRKSV